MFGRKRARPVSKRSRPSRLVKRRRVARVPRSVRSNSVYVQRKWYAGNWAPNTVTVNNWWRYYQLSMDNLPSVNEFTSLFDSYKIHAIRVEFRPRFDNFAGNDTTDQILPGTTNQSGTRAHVILDPRSTVSPTGVYGAAQLNSFMENGRVRTYEGNRPFAVYWKPLIPASTVSDAGFPNSGMRVRAPFLQANTLNILHSGFHIYMTDQNLTGVFGNTFDVFVTFYMTWKNLK